MSDRITIAHVRMTCAASPAQWEAETEDGRHVYARYRWGRLRVSVGGEDTFGARCGDQLHGDMTYAELRCRTAHLFIWPEHCAGEGEQMAAVVEFFDMLKGYDEYEDPPTVYREDVP